MKKPAISVPSAAIKFSGALLNVISARCSWTWTRTHLKNEKIAEEFIEIMISG